ncbi:TetR/AcrR family transcriptional regulator [Actinomadura decatromicini]|uniref:TetR/AcrR family transcriptional regulator n=1 Tax=Actinomadura decatromicini TaxID=2604572 RepID=A0A5D3FCA4_9ACTN|nr:TetR/AcrR family transcriptional regulator [Actinomadura decatromicini]TYK45390.1 TetR/AcrR family transcriptional regulator [Actinomadura decatromicini]
MPTPSPSVWLRPERPSRDRRLSRARIVARAVAVLDAEGARGLSMRRIASDLGVTAGSLYWYVTTKDELLELALDDVLGEVVGDGTASADGWRDALGGLARRHRAMLLRHPWVLSGLAGRPNLGPNALALAEAGLTILSRAGFADGDLDAALAAVNDHVVGAVTAETSWRAALDRTGGAEWREQAAEHLRRIAEEHPLLGARMSAAAGAEIDVDRECERRFAFALDCLLDGLEARRPSARGDVE